MTEIEAFLLNQEKFRCERMNGSLTVAQCTANKKSGKYFSCEMCKGLGERIDVGTKNTICTTQSCTKYAVRLGMCWKCCKAAGIDPATGGKLEVKVPSKPAVKKEVKEVQQPIANSQTFQKLPLSILGDEAKPVNDDRLAPAPPAPSAIYSNEAIHSDEIAYLRGVVEEALNTWSNDLHDAPTPRRRAELFISMCGLVDEMGR